MKLAVKFYSQVENPSGLPGEWPAEVLELADAEKDPIGYSMMTPDQYISYRASKQSLYDTWNLSNVVLPERKAVLKKQIKDAAFRKITESYPLTKQFNIQALMGYSDADRNDMWSFVNAVRDHSNILESMVDAAPTMESLGAVLVDFSGI